jgi:hypothetical protein
MDVLEAHTEDSAHAVSFRLADLLHLDGKRRFSDTPSLHFDMEALADGHGDEALVAGRLAAGSKRDKAPHTRGLANTGRADVPQIVIGLAVPRDEWPVRH